MEANFERILQRRNLRDYLGLAGNKNAQKLLRKYPGETIVYSDLATKINRKEKAQERAFVVTDKAFYNLTASDYSRCKRRLALEEITGISNGTSEEFVLHTPSDNDYRLLSLRKDAMIEALCSMYEKAVGHKLPVEQLSVSTLKDVMTTRKERSKGIVHTVAEGASQGAVPAEQTTSNGAAQRSTRSNTIYSATRENVGLEDFDLLTVLGRGSFGKVMLVRRKINGMTYAMKALKKDQLIARNQVEHTMMERTILESVQHPFLVRLQFAFQTHDKLYFVLDYLRGGELFFHLKKEHRFVEDRAKFYGAEIALGLGHLHSHNIVYRDLKPENILLDDDGHACITDFGMAKRIETEPAMSFCGTPEYLAPEVILGTGHGKAVDWWSFGILLYEMMVGLPPFYSENVHVMYELIQHGELRLPSFLSDAAKSIITQLLKRNPLERLGSGPGDIEDIKAHPFFADVNFSALQQKKIRPPFKPFISGAADTSNFDEEFTAENVISEANQRTFLADTAKAGDNFRGFSFK
eukprot:GILK01000783.1.p1 GENE.GILK01000783.1~~GILK01000783.1.p1  ORF type:complete len:537 (-),score=100.78 GILK01000783.1:86-1654(-)